MNFSFLRATPFRARGYDWFGLCFYLIRDQRLPDLVSKIMNTAYEPHCEEITFALRGDLGPQLEAAIEQYGLRGRFVVQDEETP